MGPQVPEVQNDWDGLVKGNPDMVGNLGSGFGDCGKQEAFFVRNFQA